MSNLIKSILMTFRAKADGGMLAWLMGCKEGKLPSFYLGLPLGLQSNRYSFGIQLVVSMQACLKEGC